MEKTGKGRRIYIVFKQNSLFLTNGKSASALRQSHLFDRFLYRVAGNTCLRVFFCSQSLQIFSELCVHALLLILYNIISKLTFCRILLTSIIKKNLIKSPLIFFIQKNHAFSFNQTARRARRLQEEGQKCFQTSKQGSLIKQ
jgi:hypothetical protein